MRSYFNLSFILLGMIMIVYIYRRVQEKLFPEKESILWLFLGFTILFLSVFPKIIDRIAHRLGVSYPPSLLFLICLLFLLVISIRQAQQISLLNEKIRELAQHIALINEKTGKDGGNTA